MTMPTFTDGVVVHQASLNALSTGINSLNSLLTGAVAPRAVIPTCSAFITGAKAVANTTDTVVTFDSTVVNNDSNFVASVSPLTVNTAGNYIAVALAHFATNATGIRALHILLNGTSATSNSIAANNCPAINVGEGNALACTSLPWTMAVGATVYMSVWQSSGGSLNLTTSTGGTWLALYRLGN